MPGGREPRRRRGMFLGPKFSLAGGENLNAQLGFAGGLALNQGVGVPLTALAQYPRLAIAGDSIALALGTYTSSNSYNTLNSISGWANMLGGGSIYFPQGGNVAVGGRGIATIATNFTAEVGPIGAQIIFCNGGINDLGTLTPTQILAQWDIIIAAAAALPEAPYLVILPITPSSTKLANDSDRLTVNAGLAARASNKVRILDLTGFDYTTMTYSQVIPASGEHIHPNVLGCQLLGPRLLAIFRSITRSYDPTLLSTDPANKLGSVGSMAGTGGSKNTATGVVADGWTLDSSGAGGATVVGSKSTLAGGEVAQQIVISGTYTGSSKSVVLTTGSVAISGVAAGDLVEVVAKIEFDAGAQNVDAFGMTPFIQDSGFASRATMSEMVTNVANDSGHANPGAYTMTVRSMPFGAPSNTPAYINMILTIPLREGGSASACAATMRVGKVSVRKITAELPGRMAAPSLSAGSTTIAVTRAADPPNNGAALSSYDLRYSTDGVSWTTASMTSSPQTITGLSLGTAYQVQTRASNSVGAGAWSPSTSVTTSAQADIITNGNFSGGTTGWGGFGFSGKSVAGGKAVFSSTPAFDGITETIAPTASKWYEVTFTVSGYSAGNVYPSFNGTGGGSGTQRAANGTYVERIQAGSSGTSTFALQAASGPATLSIDDVSCIGPYNTSTVSGP